MANTKLYQTRNVYGFRGRKIIVLLQKRWWHHLIHPHTQTRKEKIGQINPTKCIVNDGNEIDIVATNSIYTMKCVTTHTRRYVNILFIYWIWLGTRRTILNAMKIFFEHNLKCSLFVISIISGGSAMLFYSRIDEKKLENYKQINIRSCQMRRC